MPEVLDSATIRRLAERRSSPCVSIYMPVHHAGREIAQDPIRLKNLIRQAETRLNGKVSSVLEPARRLLDDPDFWRRSSWDGLAIFASGQEFEAIRLPQSFPESVTVAGRFCLKPLLGYLNWDAHCYVLALSLNKVRLLEASRVGIREVDCPGLPRSMKEAVPSDEPEPELRWHPTAAGASAVMYHGHGEGEENVQERLLHFFRLCDAPIAALLRADGAPLWLACVEEHAPLYRQVNTYASLQDPVISGSPETLGDAELFARASGLMNGLGRKAIEAAVERYRIGKPRGTSSDDLGEVLKATTVGRVDAVFIPTDREVMGSWDPDEARLELGPAKDGACDLLDVASVETYLKGGRVFAVPMEQMPDRGPVAGVFRF